jgi:hypothetical protein
MNGDQFQCVLSNPLGTVTTLPCELDVVPYVNPYPTAASPSTHSGGGGAVSTWFLSALALLGLGRYLTRGRRQAA